MTISGVVIYFNIFHTEASSRIITICTSRHQTWQCTSLRCNHCDCHHFDSVARAVCLIKKNGLARCKQYWTEQNWWIKWVSAHEPAESRFDWVTQRIFEHAFSTTNGGFCRALQISTVIQMRMSWTLYLRTDLLAKMSSDHTFCTPGSQ